jgi:hypothetical protein
MEVGGSQLKIYSTMKSAMYLASLTHPVQSLATMNSADPGQTLMRFRKGVLSTAVAPSLTRVEPIVFAKGDFLASMRIRTLSFSATSSGQFTACLVGTTKPGPAHAIAASAMRTCELSSTLALSPAE